MATQDLSAGDRRRARTRAALLEAARELFSERGYHQTRVDEITGRAGVATGTFYLYFKDKPAIGLASIPLAFATVWLAVYYTPTRRLRNLASQRMGALAPNQAR